MNEYLIERFLAQYYLLEAICGDLVSEETRRESFYSLAKVFHISDEKMLREYYETSCKEPFKDIKDLPSYDRFCRTLEYAQKVGQSVEITDSDRMMLAQKRTAMAIKSELFKQTQNLTRNTVSSVLFNTATNGNIDSMALLSYMEYHGICVCKDAYTAVKRMRACARWNNVFGNLMGIAYDPENARAYYNTLYTVLCHEGKTPVFEHICRCTAYEGGGETDQVARIIEKAFGIGAIKRGTYDRNFAGVAFSKLISVEDKRNLLLTGRKDAAAHVSDIPFNVSVSGPVGFDGSSMTELPLQRDGETRKILRNITVAMKCPAEAYMPLLVVTPEDYIEDMYVSGIRKGFPEGSVVEIDAATLARQDFIGGRENVFLRGLSETKSANTVFMIKNCEALESEELDELLKVLDYEYRRKFKLFQPPVSLDLSGLMFVLFASKRNDAVIKLSGCCDTVWTERIRREEKTAVVEAIFRSRAASFGCPDMAMEEGCGEFLAGYDSKQLQQIIDGALRCAVYEESTCISLDSVKAVCNEQNIAAPRRGFGYTGGDNNNAKN